MENIDGYKIDPESNNLYGQLSLIKGNLSYNEGPFELLDVQKTNQSFPSEFWFKSVNATIIKNRTDENFISYMTSRNETLAYMTIDGNIYEARLYHGGGSKGIAEYNEEIFMQDSNLLKKHMATIKAK